MKLIELKHVEKRFKGRKIIKDINFSIHSNEVVALVGTNGAGKTTTIRMILGITSPDHGEVFRWTKDFNKKVGVQLQATPFFEGFNVVDNLKLFSTFYQSPLANEELDAILTRYQLFDAKTTNASKLSLGQQKRLAISITTLHNPDFVILDEPSAGLDPSGQREVQNMIHRLKQQGKSILFSSHDMLEVKNTADRVLVMDDGRLLENGKPLELLGKYDATDLEELFYILTRKENPYV
ncbi:ABC transporter ATP-binding protein [Halalkalibacter sp. AB-rgal2]|uniref:ABC transporter ATP-binding protein n=1 Tax=Halalkalibacter sp. AB-rgal2 TaxID=3242695 RepID=UPI00359EC010